MFNIGIKGEVEESLVIGSLAPLGAVLASLAIDWPMKQRKRRNAAEVPSSPTLQVPAPAPVLTSADGGADTSLLGVPVVLLEKIPPSTVGAGRGGSAALSSFAFESTFN